MASRKELSARTGYSANDLDRMSDKRDDAAHVEALRAHPEARTFVITGENVILERDSGGYRSLFTFAEAGRMGQARETAFLGHDSVGGAFAAVRVHPHVQRAANSSSASIATRRRRPGRRRKCASTCAPS